MPKSRKAFLGTVRDIEHFPLVPYLCQESFASGEKACYKVIEESP